MIGPLHALWTKSPQAVVRKASLVLRGRSLAWDYSIERILDDRKHMDHAKIIDRWHRYWRVVEAQAGLAQTAFGFRDQTVVELGCGPLFGFGPLAVFGGCHAYFYLDPNLDGAMIKRSDILWSRYFGPMYEEMAANYQVVMEMEAFRAALIDKVQPLDLASAKPAIDLILSNSCLEHIERDELTALLMALRKRCHNDTKIFHAVDFSPHTTSNRLAELYEHDDGRGLKHINGLRPTEMEHYLRNAGFDCRRIVYKRQHVDEALVTPGWASHGSDDLETQVAFFVGTVAAGDRPPPHQPDERGA